MLKSVAELRATGDLAAINGLVPYARTVGLELLRDEVGLMTALRFREHNIGNFVVRAIHGGVVGALLEHAAMMHLLVETEVQVVPRIVNVSIDYLRPCRAEDTYARGSIIRQGRTVANVRVTAWQADPSRLVAAAHAHFLLT
ncbi:MAG: PaaI family thioesterase [Rhodospirillales bacterium]|nr:PaaI family thioesterase [Rhodospirillales bacterium]